MRTVVGYLFSLIVAWRYCRMAQKAILFCFMQTVLNEVGYAALLIVTGTASRERRLSRVLRILPRGERAYGPPLYKAASPVMCSA